MDEVYTDLELLQSLIFMAAVLIEYLALHFTFDRRD